MFGDLKLHFQYIVSCLNLVDIALTNQKGNQFTFDCQYFGYCEAVAQKARVLKVALETAFDGLRNNSEGINYVVYQTSPLTVRVLIDYEVGTIILNFHAIENTLKVDYVNAE